MPVSYTIDPTARLVQFVISGEFESADIMTLLRSVAADPNFQAGFDFLSDNRLVTRPVTTEQVKLMASFVAHGPPIFVGARAAFVTNSAASFGMMRMFASLAEEISLDVRVFSDVDAAGAWLSQPRPSR